MDTSNVDWDLLSSYAGLLSLATLSIYAGSFGSLPPEKSNADDSLDSDEEDHDDGERMTLNDAYIFPIVGSVALVGLYLVVKYFGTEWINWFLGWYFSIAGVGSVWKASVSLLRYAFGESTWKKFDRLTVIANKGSHALFSLSFRTPSLFLFPIAIIPSAAYHFWSAGRRSVLVTDILGLSFSYNALGLLKLDSFKTGAILLSGLFLYDIWWVFGTEVMVKVATTLDLPIKIMWPKSLLFSGSRGYTMLGLGDIVIPGTFVALALRYDYARFSRSKESASSEIAKGSKNGDDIATITFNQTPKPYFAATLTAYVLGLVTTMVVMHMFGKAQPALLYLSPACILSFVFTAAIRGEFEDAWGWSDLPPEEDDGETSKEVKAQVEKGEDAAEVNVVSAKLSGEAAGTGVDLREKHGNGTTVHNRPVPKSLGRR
ncbi:hypothetical protein FA15DRAFT_668246 [Coprinopsis marcescibilis]|uniref:Peptidase A22B, signal peptide peptidase n=1 Tax=Coprinopsis marcescibilis TaxID=230819 RepID=A0A5C3KYS0_COPMA|nr:hypothetical protein FA15DRAFT_668246 [Coprinopsis marcescibilis]